MPGQLLSFVTSLSFPLFSIKVNKCPCLLLLCLFTVFQDVRIAKSAAMVLSSLVQVEGKIRQFNVLFAICVLDNSLWSCRCKMTLKIEFLISDCWIGYGKATTFHIRPLFINFVNYTKLRKVVSSKDFCKRILIYDRPQFTKISIMNQEK